VRAQLQHSPPKTPSSIRTPPWRKAFVFDPWSGDQKPRRGYIARHNVSSRNLFVIERHETIGHKSADPLPRSAVAVPDPLPPLILAGSGSNTFDSSMRADLSCC